MSNAYAWIRMIEHLVPRCPIFHEVARSRGVAPQQGNAETHRGERKGRGADGHNKELCDSAKIGRLCGCLHKHLSGIAVMPRQKSPSFAAHVDA
jgi:hypothetical protein